MTLPEKALQRFIKVIVAQAGVACLPQNLQQEGGERMSEILLSELEVAELKGCTRQHVWSMINRGKLKSVEIAGRSSGEGGINHRIPLTALDQHLQIKYKRRQKAARTAERQAVMQAGVLGNGRPSAAMWDDDPLNMAEPQEKILPPDYEAITAEEREQIAFWKGIIKEWDNFRAGSELNKAEADNAFVELTAARLAKSHPHISLTVRSLYRKRKALYSKGEAALIDKRGKHGKHAKKLTDEMFDIFEYYYLDESRKTATLCRFLTNEELKRLHGLSVISALPELPSIGTFERAAKSIPIPYIKWFREGKEAFISDCAPYIRRMYDDLAPNDIWVADGHTFDIMVLGKDGKPFRPYLSAFMDVRTRKMMGWVVAERLCGDVTIYALKRGVEIYGAPKAILGDKGREYLLSPY